MDSSELSRAAGDMSVFAVVVVIAIILVVAISMYYITSFLNRVVNRAGRKPPSAECAVWLRARQERYLAAGAPSPATGRAYTRCEAAAAAALDAAAGKAPPCPPASPPPSPLVRDPYAYYVAADCA